MLNIWCLKLKEKDQVTLKLQISIHIGLEPVHGKLFSSLLCLSFPDNHIVMINTPKVQEQQDTRVIAMTHSFSKMSLLTHQAEDDHTSAIIALQCCPRLSLFATSGKDGYVKVWNKENHLVSEIEFGESLASVCFANSRGDLLVGFQKHVSLIQARDYLPEGVIDANYRDTLVEDCMEQPMTFDSDLEFWYDSERMSCFPAEQEGRRQWNHDGDSSNSIDHQPTIEENQSSSATETSAAEMRDSTKSLQSKVDSCMAQKLSQQYAEELYSRSPSKLFMKKHGRMPHRGMSF
jgi:WD40 repeat protein